VRRVDSLPFFTRLWLAWVSWFRIVFDGAFAARVNRVRELGAESEPKAIAEKSTAKPKPEPKADPKPEPKPSTDAALQLLALLQREGRLIDFLEEDVASFPDADIGAAARVVHAGCRKALREHLKLEAVRPEDEGAKVTLPEAFDPAEVKLTGNLQGKGPYSGTLRHRGWRAVDVKLPTPVAGHDARVVAQAEVEL
jgi:hypothetical protein